MPGEDKGGRRSVPAEAGEEGAKGRLERNFEKNEKKRKKHLHSAFDCAIINKSPGDSGKQMEIRVWRSLVSRLNGVQEALSSNLNTRTIQMVTMRLAKARRISRFRAFQPGFFLSRRSRLERKGWK